MTVGRCSSNKNSIQDVSILVKRTTSKGGKIQSVADTRKQLKLGTDTFVVAHIDVCVQPGRLRQ